MLPHDDDGIFHTPLTRHRGGPGRFRGLGRGRTTRRVLAQGGEGIAQRLNDAVGAWEGVRITPMFGRWGYFTGSVLFGCFPVRRRDHDLWIRLPPERQARALDEAGVRPHRRFGRRGWIEVDVHTVDDARRALRWLRVAHAAARAGGGENVGEDEDE